MKNYRRHVRHIAAIVMTCPVIMPVARAEVDFRLLADVDATWVDNINLVSGNDPLDPKQSEYVLRAAPGFIFEQTGQRFNSSLEYSLQSYFYAENDDRDSAYHQGNLSANAILVPDYFFVDVAGSYGQTVIDPSVATTSDLLFESVNTADALTAQASAAFRHEYDNMLADVRYTRGIVQYTVASEDAVTLFEPLQDVDTQSGYATFGSVDELARVSWKLHYENQEATYDTAPRFRYESANAELGLLLGNSLRLIGLGGLESDPLLDTTQGGLDESFWEAGFRWRPSLRTALEAFYGEHSFGEVYRGSLTHEARLLELSANYAEGPTTQAQEFGLQSSVPVDTSASPAPNGEFFNTITTDVYLREDADASITLKGRRTRVAVSGYRYKRTYIQGLREGAVELTSGFGVGINRSLSQSMELHIGGRYTESTFEVGSAPTGPGAPGQYDYEDTLATLSLIQQMSSRVSARLEANHLRRDGDQEYTVTYVTLGISGEF